MPSEKKQISDQQQTQFGTTANQFGTSQSQDSSGTVNPWEPTESILKNVLSKYSGLNTDVTPGQSAAVDAIKSGAGSLPNFGATAAGGAGKFFNTSTVPQVGMLSDALKDYQKNIGSTASGGELDPYLTPGFADAIKTMTSDITDSVKGVYAGSGRDPSGAGSFAGTLGRGLTKGIAPTIATQFNANKGRQMDAAKGLYDASGGTAGAITGQEQVPLQNIMQGMGLLPGVNGAYLAPGQAQLDAANTAQNLPYANLMQQLQAALSLGKAGTSTSQTGDTTSSGSSAGSSQSVGVGHGTTVQPDSLIGNILGGAGAGMGILSSLGGAGGAAAGLALL